MVWACRRDMLVQKAVWAARQRQRPTNDSKADVGIEERRAGGCLSLGRLPGRRGVAMTVSHGKLVRHAGYSWAWLLTVGAEQEGRGRRGSATDRWVRAEAPWSELGPVGCTQERSACLLRGHGCWRNFLRVRLKRTGAWRREHERTACVNFGGWSVGAGLGGAGVTKARRCGYGRCKWANSFAGMGENMQGMRGKKKLGLAWELG